MSLFLLAYVPSEHSHVIRMRYQIMVYIIILITARSEIIEINSNNNSSKASVIIAVIKRAKRVSLLLIYHIQRISVKVLIPEQFRQVYNIILLKRSSITL